MPKVIYRNNKFIISHRTAAQALLDTGELIATVRIISSVYPQMIENEFSVLVAPRHRIRKTSNTAEISRLTLKQEYRSRAMDLLPLIHSYLYYWLEKNKDPLYLCSGR